MLRYFKQKTFSTLFITHDYTIIDEIYSKYRAFLPFIEFKELYRKDEATTELRTFSAEKYLQWEEQIDPVSVSEEQTDPILSLQSNITVFGRNFTIYKDKNHDHPSNLAVRPGSLVYLKAPSGAGKTTIVKIVMGLIRAQKFSAQLAESRFNQSTPGAIWQSKIWGKQASMVFQHADESLNARANIFQTFSGLPLKNKLTPERLVAALDPVFSDKVTNTFLLKKIQNLSGGQKQRINILRSLILNTPLVILDEPLNGLDFDSIRSVLDLVESRLQQDIAFLVISHNEDIFDKLSHPHDTYYLAYDKQ